jgi:hypothetical protein
MEADAVFTWDGQFCHRAWVLYVSEATTLSTALTTIQDRYGSDGSFVWNGEFILVGLCGAALLPPSHLVYLWSRSVNVDSLCGNLSGIHDI